MSDADLAALTRAIVDGDGERLHALLSNAPDLARLVAEFGATRQTALDHRLPTTGHYLYAGDTPLHVAAALHRPSMIRQLAAFGAGVNAQNRRGARPLHYAADGMPGGANWNPAAQHETVVALIALGADPNAFDRNGTTPLHRAIRNRCSAAVTALLEGGSDPEMPNTSGSTPLRLAQITTGRGGSGSAAAQREQHAILLRLEYALAGLPRSAANT